MSDSESTTSDFEVVDEDLPEQISKLSLKSRDATAPLLSSALPFNGTWKPTHNEGLPEYLATQAFTDVGELAIEYGTVHYEVDLPLIRSYTTLFGKIFTESIAKFDRVVKEKNIQKTTQMTEDGAMITVCTKNDGSEVYKVERRLIEDGNKLVIMNKYGEAVCKRFYHRI